MIVVSDTSPLNYLILVGQVDLLPAIFNRVVTPPAVMVELSHPGAPTLVRGWAALPPKWLEIIAPATIDPNLSLGAGESAAICVARELNADALLVDERTATKVAERLGLLAIGTLGVLELAAERRLIDLGLTITALRQTTFRGTDQLFDDLLKRDAQRRADSGGSGP